MLLQSISWWPFSSAASDRRPWRGRPWPGWQTTGQPNQPNFSLSSIQRPLMCAQTFFGSTFPRTSILEICFQVFLFTYSRDFPRFSFALKQNAHPWLLPFRWEELAALEGLKSVHTSIMNSLRLDHSRLDKQKRRNKKNCSNSESFAFWEI